MQQQSFIKTYFDDKPVDQLRAAVTPTFTNAQTLSHLKQLAIPESATRILEIGCGVGRLAKEITKDPRITKYCGLDASKGMIAEARKYCQADAAFFIKITGDGEMPVEIEPMRFDFAFAWLVFQHIPNTETVLAYITNACKLLAKGGRFKCQLLTNNEYPGRDLWTWHDPLVIAEHMDMLGMTGIDTRQVTLRWTTIEGTRA